MRIERSLHRVIYLSILNNLFEASYKVKIHVILNQQGRIVADRITEVSLSIGVSSCENIKVK